VALEIDGQPERLDLDDVWSRYAKSVGAHIACDSDAHSVRQLEFVNFSVATARRGWLEPNDVLNTRSLPQLLEHLRLRRAAPAQ
jgi:DNA polymerase (family 10)